MLGLTNIVFIYSLRYVHMRHKKNFPCFQLTGGLVNVSQREVMRKWTNMKFTSKAKGSPHPLLRAEQLDIKEVEQKLKLCQVPLKKMFKTKSDFLL